MPGLASTRLSSAQLALCSDSPPHLILLVLFYCSGSQRAFLSSFMHEKEQKESEEVKPSAALLESLKTKNSEKETKY